MQERKPIFYDAGRKRWWVTRRVLEVSGAIFTVLLVTFFITVVKKPNLPEVLLPAAKPALHALREEPRAKPLPSRKGRKRRVESLGKVPEKYDPLRAAFFVAWDPNSMASLQRHYRDLDILMPEALHAVSPEGRLDEANDIEKLYAWMKSGNIELPVMALVNNYDGTTWRIPEMAQMLARPESRSRLVNSLTKYALDHEQLGIVVDFEEVPDRSQKDFREFIAELRAGARGAGLKLMVALPAADWSYDYSDIARHSDAIILMNYDEHWLTSPAGPIASQEWFTTNLTNILKLVPRAKLMMGIANYAYDWPMAAKGAAHEHAKELSTQEALLTASESEATVEFDSDSLNPFFSYYDEHNHVHHVWMLDGVTAYNELRASERAGVLGTAVWRLGTVDGSLWPIWDTVHPDDAARAKLEEMPPGPDLIIEGAGDIWRISATPQRGRRTIRYDPATDAIADESIEKIPLSYRIEALGALPHKVALSFDDGPDPRWTPRILDILKEKKAKGAFFVIGEEANKSPGLLKRIYAEGHEIGNHTYLHRHFDDVSRARLNLEWELNLTQRLFESTLGIKTLLFRPPYGIDHQPETADEVALLPIPQELGYMLIGAQIDPHDWGQPGGLPPPPPDKIADLVVEQAMSGRGNIVLLHDGGGDRHRTVEALPEIIDRLRAAGFEIVPVSALVGQTRAQVMPTLNGRERFFARADGFIFDLFHWLRLGIAWIFLIGIVLVSGRALIIGLLAVVEKLRPAPADNLAFEPGVSLLIPAYNEEDVIVSTVSAALAADYPKLEVVVVNDGSADRTGELLEKHFGGNPRVRIFDQPNRGKPAALGRALEEAAGEIVVTIDADTQIEPDAVRKLVRHFADPRVGAVAGNVKVGNRDRWLTRWQALEYITSQNLEKRAFDLLDCIIVVPGAVSAWRDKAIHDCGGFSADTVAEDTDLTIAIRRAGWRVLYDEEAVGYTQAPETVAALVRQRFRWTYGTLQSVWKHRDTLGRWKYGTLGWIALPNVFLFQILLPLVSPVIDLLFVGSLALWGLAQIRVTQLPRLWTAEDVQRSLIFFLAFMLIDFLTCVIAFALEKREEWSLLWPLLIQRFYYRQMMYVVLFRALTWAIKGHPVGWKGVEPQIPTPVGQT
jgi:cellulose synthase/poly-beta-1,6-N-acetylglucosamine synthase-like glycosyltransferase/peptidoglycan/xylan/chitin deacetylase (PgdA/CDA1 family)/spore germination protein YaaH